jgi:hypothetical protein
MATDRYYIGPQNAGLQKNLKPFAIADTAFDRLQNAYLFRGRVRKRVGSRCMKPDTPYTEPFQQLGSRLRYKVGTTDAGGNLPAGTIGASVTSSVGQMFSVGTNLFTVTTAGGISNLLRTDGIAAPATLNFGTGAVVINNSTPNTDVYFYPSLPVMGIIVNETKSVNQEVTYCFDTRYSYQFTAIGWDRLSPVAWSGTDKDFFWGETHRGTTSSSDLLFVTNNVDPVRYWTGAAWTNLTPVLNSVTGVTLTTARIIISFKNRLLCLNTLENGTRYQSRCRYSQNGSPLDVTAWDEKTVGKGNFIDLPCQEAIITAQHLRDRVIVYCERSTWELCYTGNQVLPFVWQQINTELGAESTFSQIPFDQVVLGVGNVGIHACDGHSVQRIDELVPNTVFDLHNDNDGPQRVCGIRDYFLEQVYWAYPSAKRQFNQAYPDKILVHNYNTKTWAIFDDSVTAFGYEQRGQVQLTWAQLVAPLTWATWTDPWQTESPETFPKNRNVLAGNQEGFLFILESEAYRNAPSLQVNVLTTGLATSDFTVIDHNLKEGDYVLFENYQGLTIGGSQPTGAVIATVVTVNNANSVTLLFPGVIIGTYRGGGTLSRVSQIDILTKQYNFYQSSARNLEMHKIDFNVDCTDYGSIAIDYFTSTSNLSITNDATINGTLLGTPVLETTPYALNPLEAQQSQVWHPFYPVAKGEYIQLRLFYNNDMMFDFKNMTDDFQWNATIYYCQPCEER